MKETIYIIDDNPFVREALVMLIEEEPDLEVCGVVGTAAEALDAIPRLRPDLVLVDYSLPEMTGVELIKHVLSRDPNQRSAVLSGHPESDYARLAFAAGATAYIVKGGSVPLLEGIRDALAAKKPDLSDSARGFQHGDTIQMSSGIPEAEHRD